MEIKDTCCIIGHRKIQQSDELIKKIKNAFITLIINYEIKNFLLGSRSEFSTLCHSILDELKQTYTDIKCVACTCRCETFVSVKSKKILQDIYCKIYGTKTKLLIMDDEIIFKNKYTAGKSSYIERNYQMIDSSSFCIFYYNKNYIPSIINNNSKIIRSSKSGTKLAYQYAFRNNKNIINLY